jgi:hypothetical protein
MVYIHRAPGAVLALEFEKKQCVAELSVLRDDFDKLRRKYDKLKTKNVNMEKERDDEYTKNVNTTEERDFLIKHRGQLKLEFFMQMLKSFPTACKPQQERLTKQEGNAKPIVLNPQETPEDLICSICLSIPLQPVLTPCDHMFCLDCLKLSLQFQSCCPMDRRFFTMDDIVFVRNGSFAHRVWSGVQVKCGDHERGCSWSGSIADFENHRSGCQFMEPESKSIMKVRIQELEEEVRQLRKMEKMVYGCKLFNFNWSADGRNET